MGVRAGEIVVTCEHASNRLPAGHELHPELLESHIAYDPGAAPIARRLARRFAAPLYLGRYSRLIVDLNRSIGNRNLIRRVSDGHRIPFNYGLDPAARDARTETYYHPYRNAVTEAVREIIRTRHRCIHLCVHTFTPVLAGTVRGNDIGILFDPRRQPEAAAVRELRLALARGSGLTVWLNRPYSGTADGILPSIRRHHDDDRFIGIELEINQKFTADRRRLRQIADLCAAALESSSSL